MALVNFVERSKDIWYPLIFYSLAYFTQNLLLHSVLLQLPGIILLYDNPIKMIED